MISVVIPVSSDTKLEQCINSLQEKAEVVISLNNPSKQIKELVSNLFKLQREKGQYKNIKFVVCEIPKASIAGAYNNGIKHATGNKIFLMDSDCQFEKDSLSRLEINMKNSFLSKGKVIFMSNSIISNIIARARDFHTSRVINAYSPPLLFSKTIVDKIGGYYFHPSLCWLEDSEFDSRIRKAKLKIAYDPAAVVYHAPLSLFTDLKSAFWYGVGKRIGVEINIHDNPTGVVGSIRKYIFTASKDVGIIVGLYLFIWKLSLLTGYSTQAIFKLRK